MNTDPVLDSLRTTFEPIFWSAYTSVDEVYKQFTTIVPSRTKFNTYGWIPQQVKVREWLGERVVQNLAEHSYTLKNVTFEAMIGLDREDVEDDSLDMFAATSLPELAQAFAIHPQERLIYQILQAGDPSGVTIGGRNYTTTAFDSLSLFNTAHPTFATGSDFQASVASTYANDFPNTPLSAANIDKVYSAMAGIPGEDGLPMKVRPTALMVAPQKAKLAAELMANETIVQAVQNVAGSENVAAAVVGNVIKGWAKVIVVPELANQPNTWYLMDLSRPIKPFIWQNRRAPEFVAKTSNSDDNVIFNRKYLFGGDYRGNGGVTLPFLIARAYPSSSPT